METTLFVLSFIALHFPAGLLKETDRKYKRMKHFGNNHSYDAENRFNPQSSPITQLPFFGLALISSFGLALFPLFKIFDLHWFWLILINIAFSLIVSSWISFILFPEKTIMGKSSFKTFTIGFVLIGIILYSITILI